VVGQRSPGSLPPAGTLVQVPRLAPGSAHDLHVPVQLLAQQTPCSQKPESQSPAAEQVRPSGRLVQAPALQMVGATQSASAEQLVLHALVAVSQTNAPGHAVTVAATQVPVPLHDRGDDSMDPLQLGPAQAVPAEYLWQAPAPSQVLSVPQLGAPWSAHCDGTTGAWPAGMFEQVPSLPLSAHDLQALPQAVPQQTPCSQKPDAHSPVVAHGVPGGFLPQLIAVQTAGLTQSLPSAQLCRHAPAAPQRNGSHICAVPGLHAPAPSQLPASVCVEPAQDRGAHSVPAGCRLHLPAPSQLPVVPQVDGSVAAHCAAGSVPCGTGEQVPTLFATLHATQVPLQSALQQTPCWQKPESHSLPSVHLVPTIFLPQIDPLHTYPLAQSPSPVHLARQSPLGPQA